MNMNSVFSHNNDVLRRLQNSDFPECTHAALNYLVHVDTVALHASFDLSTQISTDFVLFSTPMTSKKTLDSIQELQLFEILLDFFTSLQRSTRLSIFNLIFGGKPDDIKVNRFNKLTSLAVSLQSLPLMDCATAWIQQHGHQSRPAHDVAHYLIHDFCDMHKDLDECMLSLSRVFPLLCMNLMIVFSHIYQCEDVESIPPRKLVQYVSHWLSDAVASPTPTTDRAQTPVVGLITWCVCGAILAPPGDRELYSQLHLVVIDTIASSSPSTHAPPPLSVVDVDALTVRIIELCRLSKDEAALHYAVERFAHVLQMCLATKTLRCHREELITVLWKLPPNRFLTPCPDLFDQVQPPKTYINRFLVDRIKL